MTDSIVLQLQELASDAQGDINTLLSKALMVATKLNLDDFRRWVLHEQEGYPEDVDVPDYRIVRADLKGYHPHTGLISCQFNNDEMEETLTTLALTETLSEIIHRMNNQEPGQVISYQFSAEQEQVIAPLFSNQSFKPLRVISASQLFAIVQSVRNRILTWALDLEKQGILGSGITFSSKEKEIAMHGQSIQIENFQGVFGDVSGGQIQQSNQQLVRAGDFPSLATLFRNNGVIDEDIELLANALSEEPIVTSAKFGPRVSEWIGKMISKASDGSWHVGIGAAGSLLAGAIQKYYGL